MHESTIEEFNNCFPSLMLEIKAKCLVPVLDLVFTRIEENGFTSEEILFAIDELIDRRGLREEKKRVFGASDSGDRQ